jgi:hypothetical protein
VTKTLHKGFGIPGAPQIGCPGGASTTYTLCLYSLSQREFDDHHHRPKAVWNRRPYRSRPLYRACSTVSPNIRQRHPTFSAIHFKWGQDQRGSSEIYGSTEEYDDRVHSVWLQVGWCFAEIVQESSGLQQSIAAGLRDAFQIVAERGGTMRTVRTVRSG